MFQQKQRKDKSLGCTFCPCMNSRESRNHRREKKIKTNKTASKFGGESARFDVTSGYCMTWKNDSSMTTWTELKEWEDTICLCLRRFTGVHHEPVCFRHAHFSSHALTSQSRHTVFSFLTGVLKLTLWWTLTNADGWAARDTSHTPDQPRIWSLAWCGKAVEEKNALIWQKVIQRAAEERCLFIFTFFFYWGGKKA